MSYRPLGTPGACILGIACLLLAACGRPVATTGAVVPKSTSFSIDWGHLTPGRHLSAVSLPLAGGGLRNLGVTSNMLPYYSSGHPGIPQGLYMADMGARSLYSVPALGQAMAPTPAAAPAPGIGMYGTGTTTPYAAGTSPYGPGAMGPYGPGAMGPYGAGMGPMGPYGVDPDGPGPAGPIGAGPVSVAPYGLSSAGVIGTTSTGRLGVLDPYTYMVQVFPEVSGTVATSASADAFGNVAYVPDDGQVHLLNAVTGRDYIVPTAGRRLVGVSDLALSGDGRFLSYVGDNPAGGTTIYTNDLATGAQLVPPFLGDVHGPITALAPAVDGRSLLFTEGDHVRALDFATGFIDNLALANGGHGVFDPVFLGGNPGLVAYTTHDGQFQIYNRYNGLIDTLPITNRAVSF